MQSRGEHEYGVSDGTDLVYTTNTVTREDIPNTHTPLIGYVTKKELPLDIKQPLKDKRWILAGDGEVYTSDGIEPVSKTLMRYNQPPLTVLKKILTECDGSYALLLQVKDQIYAARDPLGIKPLYYGISTDGVALASEKKALWSIGVKHPESFPPGNIASFSGKVKIIRASNLFTKKTSKTKTIDSLSQLQTSLLEAVRKRIVGLTRVAIAFSGGLDSSLLAFIADKLGVKVELYASMVEDAPEIDGAFEAAELLGLPLQLEKKNPSTVLDDLSKIIWFIEDPNRMKCEVALPLYWTALQVHQQDKRILFLGQGSDELFAGYKKFLDILSREGWKSVNKAIQDAVAASYKVNFERDEPVLTGSTIVGRFPYADKEVVRRGLDLPAQQKLSGDTDMLRKKILRKIALQVGLPKTLALKRKKSAQYGSGVHSTLTHLTKEMNTNPKTLLKNLYIELVDKVS